MTRLTLSLLVIALTGLAAPAADLQAELAKLSDRELIDQYHSTMRSMINSGRMPAVYTDFERTQIGAEVGRRGRRVVPNLLALLQAEVVAGQKFSGFDCAVSDLTATLADIGDPRAVPVMLELLEDKEQRVNRVFRRNALDCMECLTFCAMRRLVPDGGNTSRAVPHPSAISAISFDDFNQAARLYRTWLAGEGKDPAQWLPLARQRALKRLGGDDPDAIYMSAEFLFFQGGDRKQLVAPLARVTAELKAGPESGLWSYRAQRSTMPIGNWVWLLSRLGPLARPHSALLIRIQKEHGENASGFYEFLKEVSGDEIIEHLVEVLPRISARVAALKADPKTPKGFLSDDPRLAWFMSLYHVQFALDRWAGCGFHTDDERVTWWKKNRGRSREQWLSENLDTLVNQADAKDPRAEWVAREVLPDLPKVIPVQASGNRTFAEWLAAHRSRLKYDPSTETFRLKQLGD